MADDPLGYGGDTGVGGPGFFDWKSSPRGPGADNANPQDSGSEGMELDSAKDLYNMRKKLYEEKYARWDSMENALNEQRKRYFQMLQEDKSVKPPVPMAHPAPPDMDPQTA